MVHSDARGEIFVINLPDDQELVLLHSVKGTKRGGHAHDVPESILLLSGAMEYRKKDNNHAPPQAEGLYEGDSSVNRAGVYHVGQFLEDSWLIEWKIGTKKGEWKNIDYPPWREQVEAAAKGVSE